MKPTSAKEDFSVVLLAGTCKKRLQPAIKHQILNIDIAATCDKIRTGLLQVDNVEKTLLVNDAACILSFRTASKLYIQTIAAYKMQVDHLLELSVGLMKMSNSMRSQPSSRKRKLSNPSRDHASKSKIKIDYNHLLQDVEKFQEWSQSLQHLQQTTTYTETSYQRVHDVHIREITVREITVAIDSREFADNEEDAGFGNATADEISELLNDSSDSPIFKNIHCHLKRTFSQSVPEQMEEKLSMPKRFKLPHITDQFSGGTVSMPASPDEVTYEATIDNNNVTSEKDVIKPQQINCKKQKRGCRLIIDKHTKLSNKLMLMRFENYFQSQKEDELNAINPSLRLVSANDLLQRMNRRIYSRLYYNVINRKVRKLCKNRILAERRLLITAILESPSLPSILSDDSTFADCWSTIKNIKTRKPPCQQTVVREPIEPIEFVPNIELDYNANYNTADINSNIHNDKRDVQVEEKSTIEHTYAIMMELLDIWQCTPTVSEIDARWFCSSNNRLKNMCAMSRTFYALLVLVAKRFIELTTQLNSIHVRSIIMGAASEHLIRSVVRFDISHMR